MPTTRLAYLFKKYFDKTATPEEITEFMALADSEEHAAEVQALMEQTWTQFQEPIPFFSENESQSMLQSVLAADAVTPDAFASVGSVFSEGVSASADTVASQPAPSRVRRMNWTRVAASLLAIALTGGIGWWYFQHKPTLSPNIAQAAPAKKPVNDVQPGGNKARLILDDGSSIVLDSARTGVLTVQGNTRVEQTAVGQLAYNAGQKSTPSAPSTTAAAGGATAVLFNTIQTPTGGQYQVALPDGSKVWLNASSSLRFPTAFKGKDRTVELTGEAYFEIEPNKEQPFHVKVNDMTVDVLGTHFNVMAYGDEGSINTSLLEGAVRIEKGSQTRILKPGQQVLLSRETGALTVEEADTEQVVAWKNGLFQYEGATLGTIMRQVQRWYGVDVRYEGQVTLHFSGLIPRSATLTEVLHMLDLAGKAKFSLEGRTVVIKP